MPRQFFNAPTDQSPMEPMLNIALRAARKAALLIERSYERLDLVKVESKRPNDFVTEVDRAAEREIISQLRKAYPDHSFRGEESGEQPGKNSDYERSEEHTSELQSRGHLVCRLLLEKKKKKT